MVDVEGQHEWNDHLIQDDEGAFVAPEHHVVVQADYRGGGEPSEGDRELLEDALRSLENAFDWSNEGLLFVVGYSPSYFDRFTDTLSDAVHLPEPRALAEFEDPELDSYDVAMHLASDRAGAVLEAEEALFGGRETANGVDVSDVSRVLSKQERRTGFVGEGLPADNQDVEGIPDSEPVHEDAPLYMGFHTNHDTNQATEEAVTIQEGRFAGGTTMQVSKIRLELDDWYGSLDERERVQRMFTADTRPEDVGEVGEGGQTTEDPRNLPPDLHGHAEEYGVVGHGGKAARGRKGEERRPTIIRRDFNTTDEGHAGVHFVSVQREISDFVKVRQGINGGDLAEIDGIGERENNGILAFMDVRRRGNYLVPPRRHRAFPPVYPE